MPSSEREKAAARRLIRALDEYFESLIGVHESSAAGDVEGEALHVKELVARNLDRLEMICSGEDNVTGITSGFSKLDRITGGFQPANLIILAGVEAVGKTSFALGVVRHVALDARLPVLYFSTRQPREAVSVRLLCAQARLYPPDFRRGILKGDEWSRLALAVELITKADLYIGEPGHEGIAGLRKQANKLAAELRKERKSLGMIVVDSLGKTEEQIVDDALMLKGLARELDVPVIALCKLEEDPDYRSGRRPTIDDLPGAGRIEFVADVIVFMYCEDLYEVDTDQRGVAEIIVARNRNGSTGRIRLHYDAAYGRFEDPDRVVEQGDEREGPVSESDVFVSCNRTMQPTRKIIDLLHRQFREGFQLNDLLAHPSLSPGDAEQIRELVERGYRAFWLDGLYCRQKDGIWEFVDLDHQRGLFRTNPDRAVEILFDDPGGDENFDWYALVELLAVEHGSLFVFGDGAVSNGHWLVIAPKGSGILGKKFSVEKHTRSTLHEMNYHLLLKIDGHSEGRLATRKDGKVEVFGQEGGRRLYRIEPHGLYVDRAYLDGILALFRASVGDLKGIKLLCKGPKDPVLVVVDGEPRAVLMPVKPE